MRSFIAVASVALLAIAAAYAQDAGTVPRPPDADEDAVCTQPNGADKAIHCCSDGLFGESCDFFDPVTLEDRSGRADRPPSAPFLLFDCEFEGSDVIECCEDNEPNSADAAGLIGAGFATAFRVCRNFDANTLQEIPETPEE